MLVTANSGRLLLVTQADHAVLCGELAGHWGNDVFERPEPFDSVVTAARLHDVGWIKPDAEPLRNADSGRPTHVTEVDLTAHQEFYATGAAHVAEVDRYAGLLVSLHWTGLYRGRWGLGVAFNPARSRTANLDAVVRSAEEEWIALREELIGSSPDCRRSAFEQRLWSNYDLLQALDLISIFLCTAFPGDELEIRSVPLGPHPHGLAMTLAATGEGSVRFNPFPFELEPLETEVAARWIPDRRYDSDQDLHAAVTAGEAVARRWRLVR